ITRTGGVFSEMVFEQGQRHLSFYDCVTCVAHGAEFYGAYSLDGGVMVGVNARRVKTSFDEHGGMIDLEYALEIENRVSGHNKMEIEFRRVH
ncbi:MAG: DUF1934 domain-containing protein, partial [Oscillospiraceae bacterium]|nr:DUF1934 domain-containing protein [Oscillospiraceae bacterium]